MSSAHEQVIVAYVGGAGRSGSTLLSRALHRVPGIVNVGEIRLWSQSAEKDHWCSCGARFRSCPFWTAVICRAFGGWEGAPVARAQHLRRRVERERNLVALSGAGTAAFAAAVEEYRSIMDQLFLAIQGETGARVILDNSKYPSTAFFRRGQAVVDLRVIHLVRDSYGVAFSWMKEVKRADNDGRPMPRFSPSRSGLYWSLYNCAFEYLGSRGTRYLRLRYEDFINDPRRQILRVAEMLGLRVAPEDLAFVGDGEIDLVEDHGVWGNPMRTSTGPRPLTNDDAFRAGLGRGDKARVAAFSWPGRYRYGYAVRPLRGPIDDRREFEDPGPGDSVIRPW